MYVIEFVTCTRTLYYSYHYSVISFQTWTLSFLSIYLSILFSHNANNTQQVCLSQQPSAAMAELLMTVFCHDEDEIMLPYM